MREHRNISAVSAGEELSSCYLISQASLQQSRNGPYWRLELKDASGLLEAKIWSPLSLSLPALSAGQMVSVEGRVSLYRDQLQLIRLQHFRAFLNVIRTDDHVRGLPL